METEPALAAVEIVQNQNSLSRFPKIGVSTANLIL